jgi:hypothetical protein
VLNFSTKEETKKEGEDRKMAARINRDGLRVWFGGKPETLASFLNRRKQKSDEDRDDAGVNYK